MVGCRSVQVGLVKWACSPSRSCSGPRVVRQSVGVVSFGLPPWPGSLAATPLFGSSRSPCSWWQRCRSASSTTSTKRSTADPGRFRCECKSKARTEHGRLLSSLAAGHSSPCSGSRFLVTSNTASSRPGCPGTRRALRAAVAAASRAQELVPGGRYAVARRWLSRGWLRVWLRPAGAWRARPVPAQSGRARTPGRIARR